MGKSLDFYKENIQSLSFSGVSIDEQETVIVFSRNNGKASVETTDPTVLTKLKKYATTNPDEWVITNVTTGQDESDPMRITSICFVYISKAANVGFGDLVPNFCFVSPIYIPPSVCSNYAYIGDYCQANV